MNASADTTWTTTETSSRTTREKHRKFRKRLVNIEARTGEQSIERIAKQETASVLRESVSWDELHRHLAEHRFAFERKGNGAVLNCGGIFVKLSKISRECSLSKLEALLGDFQERDETVIVNASSLLQIKDQNAPEKRGENA